MADGNPRDVSVSQILAELGVGKTGSERWCAMLPCLFEFWQILLDSFDYIIAGVEG